MSEEARKRMQERLDKVDHLSRAALVLCQRAESTLLNLGDEVSGAYCDIASAVSLLEILREEV